MYTHTEKFNGRSIELFSSRVDFLELPAALGNDKRSYLIDCDPSDGISVVWTSDLITAGIYRCLPIIGNHINLNSIYRHFMFAHVT